MYPRKDNAIVAKITRKTHQAIIKGLQTPSVSCVRWPTGLSPTHWRSRGQPSEWQMLNLDSPANMKWASADDLGSGASVPTFGGVGDNQESVLDILSNIQLLRNVFGLSRQRNGVQVFGSTLPWDKTLSKKTVDPPDMKKGMIFTWCSHRQMIYTWHQCSPASLTNTTYYFKDGALFYLVTTDQWVLELNIGQWQGSLPLYFEINCNLHKATAYSWNAVGRNDNKLHIVYLDKSVLPVKRLTVTWKSVGLDSKSLSKSCRRSFVYCPRGLCWNWHIIHTVTGGENERTCRVIT